MTQEMLAEKLRVLRARQGLTVAEAAARMRIQRHTLRDLERARRTPTIPTLHKIAEGYGVPVDELLESDEEGRLIVILNALALAFEKLGEAWEKKIDDNVFDAAEADGALAVWLHFWDTDGDTSGMPMGDILTREQRAMQDGKSTLTKPVKDAHQRAWSAFFTSEAVLKDALNRRGDDRAEPQELPRHRASDAAG